MSCIRHNWSEMHEDLLIMIAKKLITIGDFIRFGAVCRAWRSVTIDKHQFPVLLKALFPWLMAAHNENNPLLMVAHNENKDYRAFFSPPETKVCNMKLPKARGCQCWGSPFGWLVTCSPQTEDLDVQLHLLDPFSRTRIRLPSNVDNMSWNDKNPFQYICKAVIVSITEYDNAKKLEYLVCLIIRSPNNLIFAKDGADTWIRIQKNESLEDVIQFNGVFYTVNVAGQLKSFNKLCLDPFAKYHANPPNSIPGCFNFVSYLVEFDQHLHMAVRNYVYPSYKTISIQVYKFDEIKQKWDEMETLGDYVLFLGGNTSIALKAAAEYPDCIYSLLENSPTSGTTSQMLNT